MATTENGIYYPNDGTKAADVLADLELMAKSIDETIGKEVSNNKYDDTKIKQDISDIKKEQQTQNSDIENLQTNDTKQDELISKLKNALINVETEESKSIHVEDASTIGQLEVLGNYEQETREGYNLLQNKLTNTTINGVTFKINEDKSITVNGTATASIIANLTTGEFEDGNGNITNFTIPNDVSTLKLIGCPSGGSGSTYKLDLWSSHGVLKGTDYGEGTNISISSDNDRELNRARIIIYAGATVNNLTFKPMLVAGTEEKPYEQYGASPSPEYPSKIVCLGSNKNELDIEEIETNSYASVIDNQNGTLELEGINGFHSGVYIEKQLKPNTDYTICAKLTEVSDKGRGRIEVNSNSNFLEHSFANLDFNKELVEKNISFKTDATGIVYIIFYCNWTGNNEHVKYENIKLEEGKEATSYSPHGQGATKISKINKNIYDIAKYPFTNRIAYNSSGGQVFWSGYCGILDYFPVKENTQYTFSNNLNKPILYGLVFYDKDKQIISVITSSTTTFTTPEKCEYIRFAIQSDTLPSWIQIELGNTATSNIEHQQTDYILNIQQEMLKGDCFVKESDGWKEVHGWNKIESYNGESITTEYISTTGELTIGATIFYKTDQYKLPCTEEQIAVLEELNNLDLYKPITNIITAEDIALLKLKYALDVKTYVNNQLANVNAQILNIAGGN